MISNPGERKGQVEEAKKRRERGESSAPTEQEPNDFAEQASLIELGGDLRPATAEIADAEDKDWYALSSRNGESWQVELTVTPVDDSLDPSVRVELGEDDDAPIEYNVAGKGEAEKIPILAVTSVPQRILITGADQSTGKYEISFQKRLSGGSVEAEPNDDINVASRFDAPGEVQGFYDRPGDRDIFYVSRAELDAEVFNLEVSPIGGLTQDVRVYTHRTLESPYLAFRVSPGRAAGLPNLELPKGAIGVWIVLTAGESYDRETSYRLKLLPHPPVDHELEAEPNDTRQTAQFIELGARLAGYFHLAEDVDRFRLFVDGIPTDEAADDAEAADAGEAGPEAADAGEAAPEEADAGDADTPRLPPDPLEAVQAKEPPEHLVRVAVSPTREEDRLALAFREGPAAGDLQVIEAQRAGESVTLCNRVVEQDSLDFEVRLLEAGEDELQAGFDYRMVAEDVQSEPGLEIEPNQRTQQADKLTEESARVGFIAEPGDVDVYAFAVPYPTPSPVEPPTEQGAGSANVLGGQEGEEPVELDTSPQSVSLVLGANPLNLGFEVLDDEGGLIAEVNRAGAGAQEQLRLDLPPGLYFVHVEASRGASCEPYDLEVSIGK